jgi:hypothetical protein
MRSCVQRAIRVCVVLTASSSFAGCAEGASSLTSGRDGGSSFAGNGGASGGSGGVAGSSTAQGGDVASSDGGALGSSGASDSGGGFGQGGSGGAAIGGSGPGGGGAVGSGGSSANAGNAGGGAGGGGAGSAGSGGHAGSPGNGGGGAGGGSGTVKCSDHPLSAKSSWVVTSSSADAASPLVNVDDGNVATRWSTGVSQKSDWLQVDFGTDVALDSVTLALGSSPGDYPRAYQVRLSELTHNNAATALASGTGQQATNTVVNLAKPAVGRYLLISQVGSIDGTWWSVAELSLACTH